MSRYSITFTPRKTDPSTMVRMSQPTIWRRRPSAAACTAMAMVRLLVMRTTVLTVPMATFRWWLASAKARG